jgi:hypothetical protein
MVGMQKPNWFDNEHAEDLKSASAEEALATIAQSPRVVAAVKDALAQHDIHAKQQGWAGPSRTQVIRKAIAEVLAAD